MAANTSPIFPLTPRCASVTMTTAATEKDGSTAATLLAAGTNGTRVDKIVLKPIGSNIASVFRLFVTGTGMNAIVMEQTVAASTAAEDASLAEYILLPDFVIPSSATLKVALGTTVAAGIQVTVFAGDY